MIECYKLYLPKSKREIRIDVSVPRYRDNITFDCLYMLDGQNAFKDSKASFGRSLRATKAFSFAAREMNKRILGIGIHNSGSDLGRINEYTPFLIDNPANQEWESQDINICFSFCYDFVHTIIPFIEKKYNTYNSKEHRFIYGSSLAAVTAIYLGVKYDVFGMIGAFSTASFLFENEFYHFLDNSKLINKNIFLYVGKYEESDDLYDNKLYYNSAINLFNYLKANKVKTRLAIDPKGEHNEETWGNHIIDFINFIYFDDLYFFNN